MEIKQNQSALPDALPIECHDLHRRMAEILALREKVASLEAVRKETQRHAKTRRHAWKAKIGKLEINSH